MRKTTTKVADPVLEETARRRWLDDNRDAIAEYNAVVAKRGVFSDGRRRF